MVRRGVIPWLLAGVVSWGPTPEFLRVCGTAGVPGVYADPAAMRDFIKSTLEREGLKPPAQPTNLRAGGVTGSQIEIQWQENATNEANIFVAATVMGTDRWMYYRFGANTAGKTFKAPSAGPYLFAVMACNDSGCSDWSNVIEVTTSRQ